jgi:hypothetical protein
MPNDLGISATDYNLLEDLAESEGYEDPMDMMEDNIHDSVVPGICISCKGTQDCEPDACANYCEECETSTVRSCLDLAGVI